MSELRKAHRVMRSILSFTIWIIGSILPIWGSELNSITIPISGLANDAVQLEMEPIQAGTFLMGRISSENAHDHDEDPQHSVTLTRSFYIGKYEITQAQWEAVMGNQPSRFIGRNRPVERVSWYDAARFCNALSETIGWEPVISETNWKINIELGGIRLPTEAEWEYICRAGGETIYSWGNDAASAVIDQHAWYWENSGAVTHDVGAKLPNAWGLHDLSGNVWEWCCDRTDSFGRYPESAIDPLNQSTALPYRVGRGGSWFNGAEECRSSNRDRGDPDSFNSFTGFRICFTYIQQSSSIITGPAVTITDDIHHMDDLANGQDFDEEQSRELVIRWNLDPQVVDFTDSKDVHIYTRIDNSEDYSYLGRTGNGVAKLLVWKANQPNIESQFSNGPEFGRSYQFRIFALTKSGIPIAHGPFDSAGSVEFLEQ